MAKQAYSIKVEPRTYPSGVPYWVVRGYHGGVLGCVHRSGEDYTASGRRKPVLSLGEAARQVVKSRIAALKVELAALESALSVGAVDPQADASSD